MIGLINLEVKCAGARSAGNPHAACDVEGAGNGTTERPIRARREKSRIQTRSVLVSHRASSRPYQGGVVVDLRYAIGDQLPELIVPSTPAIASGEWCLSDRSRR
jgi:hypothetical protein